MAVLGIVDSCRVSLDTSRYWMNPFFVDIPLNCDPAPSHMGIREVWHTTLGNWWKCDRWFRADPDVIMARSDNAFYTEGEARISAAGGPAGSAGGTGPDRRCEQPLHAVDRSGGRRAGTLRGVRRRDAARPFRPALLEAAGKCSGGGIRRTEEERRNLHSGPSESRRNGPEHPLCLRAGKGAGGEFAARRNSGCGIGAASGLALGGPLSGLYHGGGAG